MKLSLSLSNQLHWLTTTVYFFKQHFAVLFGLGLIAAFGRAVQLGAFGPVFSLMHIFLEIIIEASRLVIFGYVLGLANIKKGLLRMVHVLTRKENRRQNWAVARQKLKRQWVSALLNMSGFLVIAWAVNLLIDALAYETCLYITLRREGILTASASEWAIILFFKNLSVIPFTLIFNALFLLWVTDKLRPGAPGKTTLA